MSSQSPKPPFFTRAAFKLRKEVYELQTLPWRMKNRLNPPAYSQDTVLLFAGGRGGSTWLAEQLCNALPAAIYFWEPIAALRKKNNTSGHFLPESLAPGEWSRIEAPDPGQPFEEGRAFFDGLLKRQKFDRLLLHNNYREARHLGRYRHFIHKFVNANLLLPWVASAYPEVPKIYFVRHPGARVVSYLKTFKDSLTETQRVAFQLPEGFQNCALIEEYRPIFKEVQDTFDYMAVLCLLELIPLKRPENNTAWVTISYEDFRLDPQQEMRRVQAAFAMPFDAGKIQSNVPSQTAQAYALAAITDESKPEGQLWKWREKLSAAQHQRLQFFFEAFQLEAYSMEDPYFHSR